MRLERTKKRNWYSHQSWIGSESWCQVSRLLKYFTVEEMLQTDLPDETTWSGDTLKHEHHPHWENCFILSVCPSVRLDGQTRALILNPTAFQLFVCSLQSFLGPRAPVSCSPGMNPSGRSLVYSLHNPGEGHRKQSSSTPRSPASKHMAAEHLERQRMMGPGGPRWECRRLTLQKQKVASTNHPCSPVACLGEKSTWNHVTIVDIAGESSRPPAYHLLSLLLI